MSTLFRIICRANLIIGVTSFLLMCAIILFQVIARYIFNHALPWPEELARYLFLICTYSSICICVEENSQLRVEIIPEACPKSKPFFDYICIISSIIFYGFSIKLLFDMFLRVKNMGTFALTMPIPMYIIWLFIIIFFIFAMLLSIKQFFDNAARSEK